MRKGSDDKFSNDEFGVEGPAWADGKIINEAIFCEEFLSKHMKNSLRSTSTELSMKKALCSYHRSMKQSVMN